MKLITIDPKLNFHLITPTTWSIWYSVTFAPTVYSMRYSVTFVKSKEITRAVVCCCSVAEHLWLLQADYCWYCDWNVNYSNDRFGGKNTIISGQTAFCSKIHTLIVTISLQNVTKSCFYANHSIFSCCLALSTARRTSMFTVH